MKITNLILTLVLTGASWAHMSPRNASITAVGTATVSVTPDLARVDISVVSQGATAQEATAANAAQAGAVIAALQALIGAHADIKTISYYLSPVYNNPVIGQNATVIGYMVTNTVEVTLTNLSQAGQAIDTAIQSGANRVQGISFDLQDRNPIVAQALRTAAGRARTQADAIASGLNVHTGAVIHATEGVNTSNLGPLTGGAATAAPTTPIETGLVVVQASVTLEVAVTQ